MRLLTVRNIIETGTVDINVTNSSGRTPLHIAMADTWENFSRILER